MDEIDKTDAGQRNADAQPRFVTRRPQQRSGGTLVMIAAAALILAAIAYFVFDNLL